MYGRYTGQHRRPRRQRRKAPRRMETSKKLLLCTGAIFTSTVVVDIWAAIHGLDMMVFSAITAIAGGVFGSTIVSYENKAKMENVVKIKLGIVKFRIAAGKYLSADQMAQVEQDIMDLENAVDSKISDTVAQTIHQDADIPIYP